MKIIIITQGISPIVKPLLNSHHQIVGIIESAPRNYEKHNKKSPTLLVIRFFKTISPRISLKGFCKNKKIPYFLLTKINSEECEKWIHEKKIDLLVIHSMSQLLSRNIWSIPKYGTINLHPSSLPKYRGPNPLFWTYYFFEKKGGITIHFINEGEDTGDIIAQKEFDIPPGEEISNINENFIFKLGVPLLLSSIEAIENGEVFAVSQDTKSSPTMRAKNLTDEEYLQIIDWKSFDVERVWHILRGFINHKPLIKSSSFSNFGRIWKILNFKSYNTDNFKKGNIYNMNNRKFLVCSNGIVYFKKSIKIKKILMDLMKISSGKKILL